MGEKRRYGDPKREILFFLAFEEKDFVGVCVKAREGRDLPWTSDLLLN